MFHKAIKSISFKFCKKVYQIESIFISNEVLTRCTCTLHSISIGLRPSCECVPYTVCSNYRVSLDQMICKGRRHECALLILWPPWEGVTCVRVWPYIDWKFKNAIRWGFGGRVYQKHNCSLYEYVVFDSLVILIKALGLLLDNELRFLYNVRKNWETKPKSSFGNENSSLYKLRVTPIPKGR